MKIKINKQLLLEYVDGTGKNEHGMKIDVDERLLKKDKSNKSKSINPLIPISVAGAIGTYIATT